MANWLSRLFGTSARREIQTPEAANANWRRPASSGARSAGTVRRRKAASYTPGSSRYSGRDSTYVDTASNWATINTVLDTGTVNHGSCDTSISSPDTGTCDSGSIGGGGDFGGGGGGGDF